MWSSGQPIETSGAAGYSVLTGPVGLGDSAGGSSPSGGRAGVAEFFGPALAGVEQLAGLLEAHGVERGLIGPREMERLWERHLVNSGALAALLPERGLVVDAGSGAGLPGLVLALMRPKLRFELVDSMRRRTEWLAEAVDRLGLANVSVTRERVEQLPNRGRAKAVVSRAVARLDKLAPWTAGLLRPGGLFLALKGSSAGEELAACGTALRRCGLVGAEVLELTPLPDMEPTYVVRATRSGA
ncbi:MAG: 16S rRNA (guanine(527)-N(7))-methyltransferase RsmG [Bifidobacteriaceae bacterium]|jgi:16S rRNA (guanine527-N7)-methyltransferase|nr:16S rRNA (guanine(527)-N(7))-methyltransferase RsmG [Bifidobacteriaceae bacterium]